MALRNGLHIVMFAITGTALAGCAAVEKARPVVAGDRVGVHFTCRLKSGEIAISTEKKVADDPSLPKSVLFIPRDQDGPLMISAAVAVQDQPDGPYASFEERVLKRIASAVVGMAPDKQRTAPIMAEREDAYLKPEEIFLKMSRVRHRPKEINVDSADFVSRTGKSPVVGMEVEIEEGLPALVASVEADHVHLSLAALAGREIRTPFGQGNVKETPDDLEITIDPEVGKLVRSGPLAGRISAFDDTSFTLDYGHPYGGEDLSCDIVVESVVEMAKQGEEHAEK